MTSIGPSLAPVFSLALLACADRAAPTVIVAPPVVDAGLVDAAFARPDCGSWLVADDGFTCVPGSDPPCDGVPVPGGCVAPFQCREGWRRDGPIGCAPAAHRCGDGPATPSGLCLGRWTCPHGWTSSERGGCLAPPSGCADSATSYPGGCVALNGPCLERWPADTLFVDSAAAASGDGTRERPLQRLADAIDRRPANIAVRGVHHGEWHVSGPLRIGGCPGAALDGVLLVTSGAVQLDHVSMNGARVLAPIEVGRGASIDVADSAVQAGAHYAVYSDGGAVALTRVGLTLRPGDGVGDGVGIVRGRLDVDGLAVDGTGRIALFAHESQVRGREIQIGGPLSRIEAGLVFQHDVEANLVDLDLRHLNAVGLALLDVTGSIRRLRVADVRLGPGTPDLPKTGVGLLSTDSSISLQDVVLIDIEDIGIDTSSTGGGAPLAIDRLAVRARRDGVQARLGAALELSAFHVEAGERGVSSVSGSHAILEDGRIAGTRSIGLFAFEPGSRVEAAAVVISDGGFDRLDAVGVHAQDGGALAVVDSLIRDQVGVGAAAASAGLRLERTLIQRVGAGQSSGAGVGVSVEDARLELRGVVIDGAERVGLAVRGVEADDGPSVVEPAASLTDVFVDMSATATTGLAGLIVDGAQVTADRVASTGGAILVRASSGARSTEPSLRAAHLDIRDTRARDGQAGRGLSVTGAAADVADVRVADGEGTGFRVSAGGRLTCVRCQALRLAPGASRGASIEGASFRGGPVFVSDVHEAGVVVGLEGARLDVDQLTVHNVSPRGEDRIGVGLAVFEYARVAVARLRVVSAFFGGVDVRNAGRVDAERVWVSDVADGHGSGACVRVEDRGDFSSGWTRVEGCQGDAIHACTGSIDPGRLESDGSGPINVSSGVLLDEHAGGMCPEDAGPPAVFQPTEPFED